jgi:excisionase family DNA binding protein
VYFLQAQPSPRSAGPIRIGATRSFARQLLTLRAANAFPLVVLGVVVTDEAKSLVEQLCARFTEWRLHGEWFLPRPDLLQYITEATTSVTVAVSGDTASADLSSADDGLISPRVLAERLGVSLPTVRRWVRRGLITCYEVGRQHRFRLHQTIAELESAGVRDR